MIVDLFLVHRDLPTWTRTIVVAQSIAREPTDTPDAPTVTAVSTLTAPEHIASTSTALEQVACTSAAPMPIPQAVAPIPQPRTISIFCWILSESTSPFSVKIADHASTVDDLKDEIVKKKPNAFANIDADVLTLWKVSGCSSLSLIYPHFPSRCRL
jgi:hypothetical protein